MSIESKLNKIEEMKEIISKLEEEMKEEKSKKCIRARAKKGEKYYCLADTGRIIDNSDDRLDSDNERFSIGNYYLTREDAELAQEQMLVTQMLREIALELNGEEEVDFDDDTTPKYCIKYWNWEDFDEVFELNTDKRAQHGTIYCLSKDFLNVSIRRIGEDRLINYYKNYR